MTKANDQSTPKAFGVNSQMTNDETSLGDYSFYDCTSLTSVTIPGSVTSWGQCAFGRCASLTNVYFQGNAPAAGK
jgi:hypothetical protein